MPAQRCLSAVQDGSWCGLVFGFFGSLGFGLQKTSSTRRGEDCHPGSYMRHGYWHSDEESTCGVVTAVGQNMIVGSSHTNCSVACICACRACVLWMLFTVTTARCFPRWLKSEEPVSVCYGIGAPCACDMSGHRYLGLTGFTRYPNAAWLVGCFLVTCS